jgi:hypothetical protein
MPFQISLNAIFESPEPKILSTILLSCISIEFYIFKDNLSLLPILFHIYFMTFVPQSYFLSLLSERITLMSKILLLLRSHQIIQCSIHIFFLLACNIDKFGANFYKLETPFQKDDFTIKNGPGNSLERS